MKTEKQDFLPDLILKCKNPRHFFLKPNRQTTIIQSMWKGSKYHPECASDINVPFSFLFWPFSQ